ncbi:hypothetical protein H2O64_17885 [Kordia sp. YSTF-M3]|uniref:Uncharacterized protein n=1 Tax=Kordia aestuariivivens TaxID=2759037 RepID=A0ABR7QDP8_9FLAO|nr:hypothetical protein [Kordia aestuariivivens]MBC8756548.1 hypothetical protein [Kordia aestuariivivens]
MKSTIKYAVLFVMAFTLFLSCNQEKTDKENPVTKNKLTKESKDCNNGRGYIKNQICENEAIGYLEDYKTYIDDVVNYLDDQKHGTPLENRKALNYGSETSALELFEVLLEFKKHRGNLTDDDRIFLMNVRKPETKSKSDMLVTEVVLVIQPADGSDNFYFDFTQPCPNGCPDLPGITYPSL